MIKYLKTCYAVKSVLMTTCQQRPLQTLPRRSTNFSSKSTSEQIQPSFNYDQRPPKSGQFYYKKVLN